jgi:hypothetical protein
VEEWLEERLRQQRAEAEARRQYEEEVRARRVAMETANQRCIEKLKEAAEAEQAKSDGIRTITPEQKRAMAKTWVQTLQRDYATELKDLGCSQYEINSTESFDPGWERRKGRQTCHFCDAHVQEYSYRCPSGGAIACRGCKNKIAASSLYQPFVYKNTGAGAKKRKGKKGKGKKKVKKAGAKEEQQSDSEDSDLAELGADDNLDQEEAQQQAAEEAERKQKAQEEKQAQKLQSELRKRRRHQKKKRPRKLHMRRRQGTRLLVRLQHRRNRPASKRRVKRKPRRRLLVRRPRKRGQP